MLPVVKSPRVGEEAPIQEEEWWFRQILQTIHVTMVCNIVETTSTSLASQITAYEWLIISATRYNIWALYACAQPQIAVLETKVLWPCQVPIWREYVTTKRKAHVWRPKAHCISYIHPSGSKYTVSVQHNTTISRVTQTLLIAIHRTRLFRLPVSCISDRQKGRCTRGQVVHACCSSFFNHSLLKLRKVGIEGVECISSHPRRCRACRNGPSGRVRV